MFGEKSILIASKWLWINRFWRLLIQSAFNSAILQFFTEIHFREEYWKISIPKSIIFTFYYFFIYDFFEKTLFFQNFWRLRLRRMWSFMGQKFRPFWSLAPLFWLGSLRIPLIIYYSFKVFIDKGKRLT